MTSLTPKQSRGLRSLCCSGGYKGYTDDSFISAKLEGEWRVQGGTGMNYKTQVYEKDANSNQVLRGSKTE